jgi:2-methylisocitrate lyase-like PEP mutase family enzyme
VTTLGAKLTANEIIVAPGAYDPLGAVFAVEAGFDTLYISGASIAYSRLGRPDIGLFGLAELADTVARISERVDAALIVDADTGFGNALNVRQTVRRLERAGASAIQIEDQAMPKRCGHLDGKTLIPTAEMVGKIKAALDARTNADTLLVARTDAIGVDGLDAALDRADAYVRAGADILFVEAPRSDEDIAAIVGRFAGRIPLLAIDPVTLAVLRGRMEQIADEMDATLFRAAFNPIIAEAHDASHGLYHAETGETLVQGKSGLPIFVGVMSFAVKAVIDKAARTRADRRMGDIWIFNDAHMGGTHLSDMRLVRPYFHDGELFCWLASVGHWHDVGGAVPGQLQPLGHRGFQEAVVLPPVKLMKRGEFQPDIVDILMRNTRLPQSADGRPERPARRAGPRREAARRCAGRIRRRDRHRRAHALRTGPRR